MEMLKSNIIFLSKIIPYELHEAVDGKSKNAMQSAAIVFQQKIINGLEQNLNKSLHIFNLLPVSSYPKYYKDPVIGANRFVHTQGALDYNVGFLNVAYIKRLFISHSYLRQFKCFYRNGHTNTIFAYSMELPFLQALRLAKKENPEVQTCVIVPDMPEFNDMSINQSIARRIYSRYITQKTKEFIPFIDCFVYMTEQSAKYFCNTKPYVVVEGIADAPSTLASCVRDCTTKTILYTGTTNEVFGIINLIEAFRMIPYPNYRLVLCGCGDSDAKIRQYAREDSRICFRGVVPHDEILSLQQVATVLVNPRQNTDEYTKYSFPSKTMEYLASGVPVVAYRLDGIPAEYSPYITYVRDNTIQSLADTLCGICILDDAARKKIGENARDFVLRNKNAKVQTAKIAAMIKNQMMGAS